MTKFLKIKDKGFLIVNENYKTKIKNHICKNKIINEETGEEFECMFPLSFAKILEDKGSICEQHWEHYDFLYGLYSNGMVEIKNMCLHCVTCTCKTCDDKYYGGLPCSICGEYKFN
ncbi:hypothetical protein [Spiroplasma platyhelix]|uniref:Uncharacterized protein n=1 Tax=Spiroplasma platyhelix PALS-1 TaxID=1276218 RepID=A0A846UD15_9MOLU|nr:hypothetical protein [Spiroplasma platyhelix]MBE4704037.1 hypothetical protein [Spiroplasma platyhelix PALS-1]NKE38408.1 hypothetical protein [Spiroplasma platyhelix PALS-1]UJB29295.1 hypothetical protein SPLAT_v1c05310 [Spiroplasma platyhelix PALS-1]